MNIYARTAVKQLLNTKLYSSIDIVGLATGLTAMLLALLYWKHESSYDQFHVNHKNIYRITTTLRESKETDKHTVGATGQVQGPAFLAAVPEMKSYTRVMGGDIFANIAVGNTTQRVRPLYVDSNFLSVFSFRNIHGSVQTALTQPNFVVLTASTAQKRFGTTNVVGKLLDSKADPSHEKLAKPLMISAVVEDPPEQSSLQFDLLFPFAYMELSFTDNYWLNAYLGTFVVLDPKADLKKVAAKFDQIYASHAREQLEESLRAYSFDPQVSYGLQNITDIHLDPLMVSRGNAEAGVINGSNAVYSTLFLVIAAFILLMASINFINISIAGALRRSKEVAIRKISGGSRSQVMLHFLFESSALCLAAFVVAAITVYALLPMFNELTGKSFHLPDLYQISFLYYLSLLVLVMILFNGLYPAIILSRFKPVEVLYNRNGVSAGRFKGRILVVAQFVPAIVLLIAALVYYKQMEFVRKKDPGYNPDYIVRSGVYGDRDYKSVINFISNELAKEPFVEGVSFGNTGYNFDVKIKERSFEVMHKTIDPNYFGLMEIPFLLGRSIASSPSNADEVVVNETFVRRAGLQSPIGSIVELGDYYNFKKLTIVGVVKDHHYQSLKYAIVPMIFFQRGDQDAEMWVKLNKQNLKEGIGALEKIYKAAMPDMTFEYSFLDELNARDFLQESRWYKVIWIATIIGLSICGMGLFGLAHQATFQRIKEIGIRKVLGATVTQIVWLVSSRFLTLVILSFVIACPIAWLLINRWLMNYAYRINIGAGEFVFAALLSIVAALAAVLSQSIRSALVNPVNSLRH